MRTPPPQKAAAESSGQPGASPGASRHDYKGPRTPRQVHHSIAAVVVFPPVTSHSVCGIPCLSSHLGTYIVRPIRT